MKPTPIIRKSGRDWVIDRGPNKAMPCCKTKAEAEQLLACAEKWQGKKVSVTLRLSNKTISGRVVNTGIFYKGGCLVDMLAVRRHRSTYWLPAADCEEVDD
jgi:hypothetical protein